MKPLKVYLDTSIINFLYADDAPEFKQITHEFFENHIRKGRHLAYVSEVMIREIEKTKENELRINLLNTIREYNLPILTLTEEADRLAGLYIKSGIIPLKKREDAEHVALATANEMDVLLSWNFRHLANLRKQIAVKSVNEREGYLHSLVMTNPMELLDEDE